MITEFAFGTLGLAVTGAALELAARAWIRRADRWYIHQPFGRRRMTIATSVLPQVPEVAHFSVNADGERGDPVPHDFGAVERVLVAGGSAAECFMLDQGDTWSAQLQAKLNQGGGRQAHVGNVARSLITCRTINSILARVLPKLQSLDTVILMVGASDLVAWFEAKTPETLEEGEITLSDYVDEHPTGPFTWSLKGAALYQLARGWYNRVKRPLQVKENAGGSIAKHRAARAATANLITAAPDPRPMLDGFEKHLSTLIDTCLQSASRVIVARQPWLDRDFSTEELGLLWNFGQGSPYRGAIDGYYEINLVRRLMGEVDEVAARVAQEKSVDAIDLRTVVPSDFEHYYDFLHFTPKGCERVSQALADLMRGAAPVKDAAPRGAPRAEAS